MSYIGSSNTGSSSWTRERAVMKRGSTGRFEQTQRFPIRMGAFVHFVHASWLVLWDAIRPKLRAIPSSGASGKHVLDEFLSDPERYSRNGTTCRGAAGGLPPGRRNPR